MSYFRAENLSLHFGGLRAVDSVSFAVEKGEILSIIGPNGAGKSSIFNLISRIYPPTHGRIFFEDQDITQQPAYDIAKLGIARTFQNIELFENATVLANLLVGRHRHEADQWGTAGQLCVAHRHDFGVLEEVDVLPVDPLVVLEDRLEHSQHVEQTDEDGRLDQRRQTRGQRVDPGLLAVSHQRVLPEADDPVDAELPGEGPEIGRAHV